jgi:hypothetical protein
MICSLAAAVAGSIPGRANTQPTASSIVLQTFCGVDVRASRFTLVMIERKKIARAPPASTTIAVPRLTSTISRRFSAAAARISGLTPIVGFARMIVIAAQ